MIQFILQKLLYIMLNYGSAQWDVPRGDKVYIIATEMKATF